MSDVESKMQLAYVRARLDDDRAASDNNDSYRTMRREAEPRLLRTVAIPWRLSTADR